MKGKRRHPARARHAAGLFDELVIDNFAGGGGATLGIERALGRAVDVAVNHDPQAVAVHRVNHPHTLHHCEDVWSVDPAELARGRPVGLAWFSPDCCHFSRAKGGKPVQKKIRGLAWVVIRWAKRVRPRVIMLENVREFQDWGPLLADDRPCPSRKGLTFRRWVGCLRSLGYAVEWKCLDAADFGAPTHRRRLFLVARCDGLPIVWPEPSHGPGRSKPYRTAAECIDWSLPCPSIFLTREEGRKVGANRPLAEKTMRRIALGIKRFVLDNPRPFLVRCDHGGDHFRGQPAQAPLATITGRHGFGVIAPFLAAQFGEAPGQLPRAHDVAAPIPTITPRNGGGFPLIAPVLVQYNGEKAGEVRGGRVDEPVNTITADPRFALSAANLVRIGQTGGNGHYVNAARSPLTTITSKAEHCLAISHLTKFYGTNVGLDPCQPLPTITGQGQHLAEVRAFLTKYFGSEGTLGQACDDPLHTVTGKARFGLVLVAGMLHQIADIGLRMLRPRELFRCQGFNDSYIIDPVVDGRRLSVSVQVRLCGNSVCPQVAEAIVRANCGAQLDREVAS
jgi:DNA (cytosine-5)-methyltransferase 1